MYVGRDFDPSDGGESERYTFDFINDFQSGDSIASVVWACSVAARSDGIDIEAADHISEPPIFTGTKTTQRVTGMQPGVTYVLTATATTVLGDVVSLWSHVECRGASMQVLLLRAVGARS